MTKCDREWRREPTDPNRSVLLLAMVPGRGRQEPDDQADEAGEQMKDRQEDGQDQAEEWEPGKHSDRAEELTGGRAGGKSRPGEGLRGRQVGKQRMLTPEHAWRLADSRSCVQVSRRGHSHCSIDRQRGAATGKQEPEAEAELVVRNGRLACSLGD